MSRCLIACCVLLMMGALPAWAGDAPVSDATQECLGCHAMFHPGIVADWENSRHSRISPAQAMTEDDLARRVSADSVPDDLAGVAVGCAECHTLRVTDHADRFDHNGFDIHVVVSPNDCAVCHPDERSQYAGNIMSHARANLADNSLYNDLQRHILGTPAIDGGRPAFSPAGAGTRAEGCYYCHGTQLAVAGTEIRDTDAGELEFPVIDGWPNQGVGRVNLDGSLGACTPCHTRHRFSIETARKPYTCKECHAGPDVPAYKVYAASKHGNLFSSHSHEWDFSSVPWTLGTDFTAPTCAACHISLVVTPDGAVLNERTHTMSDRLDWRIFGLIYAHPQPKSPDTTVIQNKDGLSLPTTLSGGVAGEFLIDEAEMASRKQTMQRTCRGCHDAAWVTAHFDRRDHTIAATNQSVKAATDLLDQFWKNGFATNMESGGSLFDEAAERRWMDIWLIHANNIRFASAMAGGGDYGVFDDGRYPLSTTLMDMAWMLSLEKKASQ